MKRRAKSEQQRMSILSNELIRRLSNVHISIMGEEMHEIIDHYIGQLKLREKEKDFTDMPGQPYPPETKRNYWKK